MERQRRTHAEARAQMRAGILRLGRVQLATAGAAGLSVREIARGLGVASSAIYRHVANRDALLTLLVVDAYTELADAVDVRLAGEASGPGSSRLAALARAMREWAVAQPEAWALLYGSPVPGYAAPAEETTPAGTRVMFRLLAELASGDPAVRRSPRQPVSDALAAALAAGVAEHGGDASAVLAAEAREAPGFAADALEAWSALVGLVSAEVFAQHGDELARHGRELLERWIASTAQRFGLR
ncbi:TetR/AcrR family transcriptional regulator [Leucobacter allii]|uniref:TetR/AcrR family transcriptional regulator n=1 Tax=Leucobacter allii TaxID=2932247 RepID=UPI001FD06D88|nr:TetR/AcrR family transcriptional regulator [Leucobacter allii]UOR02278.1 TetR/AcrR family transcriptional regulator [Leucobacter allii]